MYRESYKDEGDHQPGVDNPLYGYVPWLGRSWGVIYIQGQEGHLPGVDNPLYGYAPWLGRSWGVIYIQG